MARRADRLWWIAAALVALLGAGLRLWHIAATPLWLDEAYSAYAADHDFAFLWHVVPTYETHPPFYYALLRLWTLTVGNSLVSLRIPGLIAGLVTPPVLALAAWQAGGLAAFPRKTRLRATFATFALACLAISLVEMAREVRPYPLMILAYALAMLAVLRLQQRAAAGQRLAGRSYAAYLSLLAATLWLHNLGVLFAAALVLALAAAILGRAMRAADWAWLAGGHAIVCIAWLPALMILRGQAPTWIGSTWLRFAWTSVPEHLAVLYAVPGWQGLAALLLAALGLGALASGGERRRLAAILIVLTVGPVLLSLTISVTIAPIFLTRTLTPVAAPTLLLLAIGATAWTDWRRWLGLGGALMLGANMLAVDLQARAAPPPQDWYRTIDWLALRVRPGDIILAYPNEGALPLHYALRDRGVDWPIRPIPTAVPSIGQAGGWYPTGSRGVVSLPRTRLQAIADAPDTRAIPTIWLLRLGAQTYDPGDTFLHELHRGRVIIRTWRDGPIDLIGLRRRDLASRDQRKTRK